MKYLIVATSYDENSGGVIALHKLCHVINSLGGEAYLHPRVTESRADFKSMLRAAKSFLRVSFGKYNTNPSFNTPIKRRITKKELEDFCVVYPENISGNPIGGKRVVRWFLHHPGYHSGQVNYFSGELYFSYDSFGSDFSIHGSKTSEQPLRVTHFFNEYYNDIGTEKERTGVAYCLRKGKDREMVHDVDRSTLIDGLSHREVASILRRSDIFVSYDLYTAYSWFAIMCGCVPVIIPQQGLGIEEWYPNSQSRLGFAYGFEQVEQARAEMELAKNNLKNKEAETVENVKAFLIEVEGYFSY